VVQERGTPGVLLVSHHDSLQTDVQEAVLYIGNRPWELKTTYNSWPAHGRLWQSIARVYKSFFQVLLLGIQEKNTKLLYFYAHINHFGYKIEFYVSSTNLHTDRQTHRVQRNRTVVGIWDMMGGPWKGGRRKGREQKMHHRNQTSFTGENSSHFSVLECSGQLRSIGRSSVSYKVGRQFWYHSALNFSSGTASTLKAKYWFHAAQFSHIHPPPKKKKKLNRIWIFFEANYQTYFQNLGLSGRSADGSDMSILPTVNKSWKLQWPPIASFRVSSVNSGHLMHTLTQQIYTRTESKVKSRA
jgi:hypothetical protein